MKKLKQVLFLYHVKEREIIINQMMAECLQKQEIAEEIIIENFENVYINAYKYSPNMIVTFLPRTSRASDFLTLMKYMNHSIIIAIPTEGLMSLDYNQMQRLVGLNSYSANLVDYYYFWGESMADQAGKVLLEQEKVLSRNQIRVFGYLPYEKDMMKRFRKDSPLLKKVVKRKDGYEQTVMFVTGFMGADITIEEMVTEGSINVRDKKTIELGKKRIEINKYYRDSYIGILKKAAEKYRNILFLVKVHPVEIESMSREGKRPYDELKYYSNIILIDKPEPISEFLDYIDLFIHYGSTTALEAYIYKIPTVQLINDHPEIFPNSCGVSYFESTKQIKISNAEEVFSILEKGINYVNLDGTNKILKGLMNYDVNAPYSPSQILSDFFINISAKTLLTFSDREVRKALRRKVCIVLYGSLIKRVFIFSLRREFTEAKMISKWLFTLLRCILRGKKFQKN